MSPNVPVTREARELPAIEAGEASSGGRAHRRSAGRDPRHSRTRRSPRGSHRTDGIPRSGLDPGSRGRGDRLGHAGRHAPAGWIGTAHDPPLEDRPGRRGSRPVPREGDRRCSLGDPPREPGSGRPRVRPQLRTLRGPPGWKARSPDTPPASGWPAISWPPGPSSSPSRSRAMDPGRPRADDQNHLGAVLRVPTGRPGRPGRDRGRDRCGGVGVPA